MKRYRVSFEDTFCRDIELDAETEQEAIEKAKAADWYDQDWCDGHELAVVDCTELGEDER